MITLSTTLLLHRCIDNSTTLPKILLQNRFDSARGKSLIITYVKPYFHNILELHNSRDYPALGQGHFQKDNSGAVHGKAAPLHQYIY